MTNQTEEGIDNPAGAQDLLHGLLWNQADLGEIGTELVYILLAAGIEPDCTKPPCKQLSESG